MAGGDAAKNGWDVRLGSDIGGRYGRLSERMFDAAKVPEYLREEYYRQLLDYLKTFKPK